MYIKWFTPPQHLHSTKWAGTALYQMIDRQLRDTFRKTGLCRRLTPRLLLWKQGDWRYCMCWGGGWVGTGGVGGLRILCKSETKRLPQPHRSSCIIYWKKEIKGESKTHRSMRIFFSPLKCQYGKQGEGFNRMYAELTGNEVMTRRVVPRAFVWFCCRYIQHIHTHQICFYSILAQRLIHKYSVVNAMTDL